MTPSSSEVDLMFMFTAIDLAENGRNTASPNPCVGCLYVRDGEVIGQGWHQWTGQGHAEVCALEDADRDVRGATAYVSLEPCAFEGRTPACAQLLIDHGVARVVIGAIDPHPRVSGQGVAMLRSAGIDVTVLDLEAAAALNPGYNARVSRGTPWVRLKVAASLDGRTAMASGESQWITGEAARADVQALRARSCAILTGVGTVLADDPSLTVRDTRFAVDGRLRQPRIVVADSHGRTPATAKIYRSEGGVQIERAEGGKVDLNALLARLAADGVNELLVEAGPTLIGACIEAQCWDEMVLYLAPKFLGASARPLADFDIARMADAFGARITAFEMVGDDLKVTLARV